MADDDETKPPSLRVVGDNPDARAHGEAARQKAQAKRALSRLAACILRTIAGSETEAYDLARRLGDYIEAQQKLNEISGHWLTIDEEREVLRLPRAEFPLTSSEYRERQWLHERGMERIVQGALRLAAHQLLGEEPHFGGKYSERLIEEGIASIERALKPPEPPQSRKKTNPKKSTTKRRIGEQLLTDNSPAGRRRPWSSRDARSYRDLPKDDK